MVFERIVCIDCQNSTNATVGSEVKELLSTNERE